MSPLERVIRDALADHWMSAIRGVCTCGEVMYDVNTGIRVVDVLQHRAKVVAEALERQGYGERHS